ncbi:DUF4262 domain-containing protein [Kitasatospora phosalacinea]|uniref:DUF4262 domain-containing protein n=1 Tax=Kitasatospora phosalacinea TaxID=2065 RepID=UPI003CC90DE3
MASRWRSGQSPQLVLSFFGADVDFYQQLPLPVTQMFWPDKQGRFPWDEGVDRTCRTAQPLLRGPGRSPPVRGEHRTRPVPTSRVIEAGQPRPHCLVASGPCPNGRT